MIKKRGVSAMIGYVLLIVIVIALAAMTFAFLRLYVPVEAPSCMEGVEIVVESASCSGGVLAYTVVNEGLFTIDKMQISTGETDRIARTILNENTAYDIIGDENGDGKLQPGESVTITYNHDIIGEQDIEFQPIMLLDEGGAALCEDAAIAQSVRCNKCGNGVLDSSEGEAYDGPFYVEDEGLGTQPYVACPPRTIRLSDGNQMPIANFDPSKEYAIEAIVQRGTIDPAIGIDGTVDQCDDYEDLFLNYSVGGTYEQLGLFIEDPNSNINPDGTCYQKNVTTHMGNFNFIQPNLWIRIYKPETYPPGQCSGSAWIRNICVYEV